MSENTYKGRRALRRNVLIRMDTPLKATRGGIAIPDSHQESVTGVVVSVGSEVPDLAVGDRVQMKPEMALNRFKIDEDEMVLINHEAIGMALDPDVVV